MSTANLFSLEGRTALVTGSSRGIGRAIAEGYAGAGARIVVNGRNAETVKGAVEALKGSGAEVHAATFDVADGKAVAAAITDIESSFGSIDILVNNAGIQHRARLDAFPEDAWDKLMRTNIDSVFHVSKAVAQGMIARGRGKIVNVCSVNTMLARTTIAPYTATKGAVANLTKGMAADWAGLGLNVNGLAPGYIATELNQALMDNPEFNAWVTKRVPSARWGKVDELVGAAIFLASEASSFVNGHILYVDGGLTATV